MYPVVTQSVPTILTSRVAPSVTGQEGASPALQTVYLSPPVQITQIPNSCALLSGGSICHTACLLTEAALAAQPHWERVTGAWCGARPGRGFG